MENKKFIDASLEEFEETMKEAFHRHKSHKKFVIDFLGITLDNLFSTKQTYPQFKMPVVCYSLPELLKEKNFVVSQLLNYDYDGYDVEVERIQVEISEDKTANVVTVGYYFLTKNNKKFVINIDFERNSNAGYVYVYSSNENKEEASQIISDLEDKVKYLNFLKGAKITPFGRFLKLKKVYTWDDIILSKNIEEEIKRNIERYLANFEIYRKNGLPAKRGILLCGDPGVGKTLLGKVLVSTTEGVTFVWVTPKFFQSDRTSHIDMLFELADELAPTILFLEDVDFYGTSREYGNNSIVLGEFLNKADGLIENNGVLIIMTTNYPEMLDKAIKERPGRFDRIIKIPLPEDKERFKMLKVFCKDLKTEDIDWKELSVLTKGFTGALLRELIITASSFAIEDNSLGENDKVILKQNHFNLAFETLKQFSKLEKKGTPGFRQREENRDENCESEAPIQTADKHTYKEDSGVIE